MSLGTPGARGEGLGAVRAVGDVLNPAPSARWFDGWKLASTRGPGALKDAAARHSPPPVVRARTWLIRIGWRRHGLLDPAEVPG